MIGVTDGDCQRLCCGLDTFALVLRAIPPEGKSNFMLQQFSWAQFLIASIMLNLIWYGFVGLVFYRSELRALFSADLRLPGESGVSPALVNAQPYGSAAMNDAPEDPGRELMGRSKLPEGVNIERAGVSFAAIEQDRYSQVGLVADVVQELKIVFSQLASQDEGKPEFLRRVSRINEDYGKIGGHPSLASINAFIRESAPFAISDEELEDLWF